MEDPLVRISFMSNRCSPNTQSTDLRLEEQILVQSQGESCTKDFMFVVREEQHEGLRLHFPTKNERMSSCSANCSLVHQLEQGIDRVLIYTITALATAFPEAA